MKSSIPAFPLVWGFLIAGIIVGCSSTPTALDRTVANVQTNYAAVPAIQTNVVPVYQTNVVVVSQTVTNTVGVPVIAFTTNYVPVTTYQTNLLLVTNEVVTGYTLTPKTNVTDIAQAAGGVTNAFVPGVGGLVTSGLLGLLSIFLGYRNRQMSGQSDALSQAAGVLAQTIETGREVMASTPQGQAASDAFSKWLVSQQKATNTIGLITQIVKDSTDNVQAQAAASQILAVINQTPTPTPSSPAPKA